MVIENEVADLVVRGVSLASANRPPELPPDTTSVSSSLKYSSLRSLEPQERPSRTPETRIRGSSSVQRRVPQGAQPLNEELDQVPAWPYDEKTLAPQVERYLYSPSNERVLVEDVQGGRLTHAVRDGSRQIEDFHQVGHGQDAKEAGALYVRDLGGQLLETTAFERKLGVTAHRRPVDDDDHEDNDRDDGPAPAGARLRHVRWTSPDPLGSSSLISNYRGNVLQRYQYGPWGERLEGDFAKLAFGFTGHRNELATGHWSSLYRHLDPRAGRWTQRDPAGRIDGWNGFLYVRNSPYSGIDPEGLRIIGPASLITIKNLLNSTPTGQKLLRAVDTPCAKYDVIVYDEDGVSIRDGKTGQRFDTPNWDTFIMSASMPIGTALEFATTSPARVGAAAFIRLEMHLGSFIVWQRAIDYIAQKYAGEGDAYYQNIRVWRLLQRAPADTPDETSFRARAVIMAHELVHAIQIMDSQDFDHPTTSEPPAYKVGAEMGVELQW